MYTSNSLKIRKKQNMSDLKKTYITNAIRRYRSLFSFPEYWVILLLTLIVNFLGSITAFMFAYSFSEGIYKGFIFGLQVLTIPTIVFHSKEDGLVDFEYGQYTAQHIPNAKFVPFESGGHLLVGRIDAIHNETTSFLRENLVIP